MSGEIEKSPSKDVAVLCGPTDDGKGAKILRAREGALEAGEIRPVKDGQPVNQGELVRLSRARARLACATSRLCTKANPPKRLRLKNAVSARLLGDLPRWRPTTTAPIGNAPVRRARPT